MAYFNNLAGQVAYFDNLAEVTGLFRQFSVQLLRVAPVYHLWCIVPESGASDSALYIIFSLTLQT